MNYYLQNVSGEWHVMTPFGLTNSIHATRAEACAALAKIDAGGDQPEVWTNTEVA